LESVQQAAERIAQYAHRTPVRPPSCRLLRARYASLRQRARVL